MGGLVQAAGPGSTTKPRRQRGEGQMGPRRPGGGSRAWQCPGLALPSRLSWPHTSWLQDLGVQWVVGCAPVSQEPACGNEWWEPS